MERVINKFRKGDVVVIPFPFSNLTGAKRRPALVIAHLQGEDLILCQITSKKVKDDYAVKIVDDDFEEGGLKQESNVRPNKIFTADKSIILYKVGKLKREKINQIVKVVIKILQEE